MDNKEKKCLDSAYCISPNKRSQSCAKHREGAFIFVPNLQSKKSVQLCLQYKSFENTVG